MNRKVIPYFIIGIVIVISILVLSNMQFGANIQNTGFVTYLRSNEQDDGIYELMAMAPDGSKIQPIRSITGSYSLSPDGTLIAAGCLNKSRLCIYQIAYIPDLSLYPRPTDYFTPFSETLYSFSNISPKCYQQETVGDHSQLFQIESISWSPNGENIVVSCGSIESDKDVCIINIHDSSVHCWEDSKPIIGRIAWSPDGNNLAFSLEGIIVITDKDGKNPYTLVSGWNPEWSPDGKRMAFYHWTEEPTDENIWTTAFPSISIINIDGTDMKTVYNPLDYEDRDKLIPMCGGFYRGHVLCSIAWSSAGTHLFFSGRQYIGGGINPRTDIFSYELKTNDIVNLTAYSSNKDNFFPDWGK